MMTLARWRPASEKRAQGSDCAPHPPKGHTQQRCGNRDDCDLECSECGVAVAAYAIHSKGKQDTNAAKREADHKIAQPFPKAVGTNNRPIAPGWRRAWVQRADHSADIGLRAILADRGGNLIKAKAARCTAVPFVGFDETNCVVLADPADADMMAHRGAARFGDFDNQSFGARKPRDSAISHVCTQTERVQGCQRRRPASTVCMVSSALFPRTIP